MDLGILETLEKDELKEYLQFLLWHYRVVDGFWFLSVEKLFDRRTAEHLDEVVWGKIAGMSAKDIAARFTITEKGLRGFAEAMKYCPWTMIVGYHIEEKEGEVTLFFHNRISFRTHWSELFEPNNASKVYLLSEVFWRHSDNMYFYPIIFYYRELL